MDHVSRRDQGLLLCEETLSLLETTSAPLSGILLRCVRIARLLEAQEAEDYFQLETRGYRAYSPTNNAVVARAQAWSGRRVLTSPDSAPLFYSDSIEVMEAVLATHSGHLEAYRLPTASISEVAGQESEPRGFGYRLPAPPSVTEQVINRIVALREKSSEEVATRTRIISAVRGVTQAWLSSTAASLRYGSFVSNALERRRLAVESFLSARAPEAAEALAASAVRATDGSVESASHALTSCRRAIKAVADVLAPPPDQATPGEELLSDAAYRNRLKKYIRERAGNGDAAKVLQINLEQTIKLVDSLDRLDSKGVHARVEASEVETAILHTYLLIGDILTLENAAAIDSTRAEHLSILPNSGTVEPILDGLKDSD